MVAAAAPPPWPWCRRCSVGHLLQGTLAEHALPAANLPQGITRTCICWNRCRTSGISPLNRCGSCSRCCRYAPYEASRKACLIYPAERMTVGAANSLLKTLEEPPGHAVIILLAAQTDLLLPTVRSRCQHLRFSPLDDRTVAALLEAQGMDRELAAKLAPLAQGSLERARDIDGEEDARRRSALLATLRAATPGRIATIFDASEELSGNREETTTLFDLLLSLIRDLLLLRTSGANGVVNHPLLEQLTAEAARFTPASMMETLELALETRRAVQGNVNPKLALDRFLLRYGSLRTN